MLFIGTLPQLETTKLVNLSKIVQLLRTIQIICTLSFLAGGMLINCMVRKHVIASVRDGKQFVFPSDGQI